MHSVSLESLGREWEELWPPVICCACCSHHGAGHCVLVFHEKMEVLRVRDTGQVLQTELFL